MEDLEHHARHHLICVDRFEAGLLIWQGRRLRRRYLALVCFAAFPFPICINTKVKVIQVTATFRYISSGADVCAAHAFTRTLLIQRLWCEI